MTQTVSGAYTEFVDTYGLDDGNAVASAIDAKVASMLRDVDLACSTALSLSVLPLTTHCGFIVSITYRGIRPWKV